MTLDRTYWRACDDRRLIEEARDSGHELAIALGERLEDCRADDARCLDKIHRLEQRLILAQAAIETLKAEVRGYEDIFGEGTTH